MHPIHKKPTIFNEFGVRAVQKTIPKIINNSSKIGLEKVMEKSSKIIQKWTRHDLKIEEKSIQNRCEKTMENRRSKNLEKSDLGAPKVRKREFGGRPRKPQGSPKDTQKHPEAPQRHQDTKMKSKILSRSIWKPTSLDKYIRKTCKVDFYAISLPKSSCESRANFFPKYRRNCDRVTWRSTGYAITTTVKPHFS